MDIINLETLIAETIARIEALEASMQEGSNLPSYWFEASAEADDKARRESQAKLETLRAKASQLQRQLNDLMQPDEWEEEEVKWL